MARTRVRSLDVSPSQDAGHHPFAGIETSAGKVDVASLVAQKDERVAASHGVGFIAT